MLKQRIITSLIALPLLLALISYGPKWGVAIFFSLMVGVATYECAMLMLPRLEGLLSETARAAGQDRVEIPKWPVVFIVTVAMAMSAASSLSTGTDSRALLIAAIFLAILVGTFVSKNNETSIGRILGFLVCLCYAGLPWLLLWELYLMGDGSRYVILVLAIVWSGDTGAYFGGRFMGKHKLAPRMSPKKTIEGAVAGLFCSVLGGFLANAFFEFSLASHLIIVCCSVIGGAIGQAGDLVESILKRFAGVKDSGSIFPGHGGFLDRADGILFAAPVVWAILYMFAH